jgi:acetoin utilization deacetylase AcuC-like enzyme
MPRFFHPDVAELTLPAGHRFPAGKYGLLRQRIVAEGVLPAAWLAPSPLASRDELITAHGEGYVDRVLVGRLDPEAQRRIGLPWSPTLVARARASVGGSLAAARQALEHGISGQLAGGTHHAHRDFGSGFCTFNDLAVTALVLLGERRVGRIAIVDLDVHQGDGNAALLSADPRTFVASLHAERNFPFRKVASDLDVGLADGTEDGAYLAHLGGVLERVLAFKPDLVLYLSGADALKGDRLGRLALTHAGLMARDRLVLETCRRQAIPVAIAIGGGYGDPIDLSITGYLNTFRAAALVFRL